MSKGKGFTLIELIMVIVIIGILAAIAIPRFIDLRCEARRARCQGSGSALRAAISNFYARHAIDESCAGQINDDFLANAACWPLACNEATLLGNYIQPPWPENPTAGGGLLPWGDVAYYTVADGSLNVDAACPACP